MAACPGEFGSHLDRTLCAIYVATGDLLSAMSCVDIRPSEFYALVDCLPAIAARIAVARRQAQRTAARLILSEALGAEHRELVSELVESLLRDEEITKVKFLRRMQFAVRWIREALSILDAYRVNEV
jgi:hypothetical protein